MLILGLLGLGWLALAFALARFVARAIAAGGQRECELPGHAADRIAWIRGATIASSAETTRSRHERQSLEPRSPRRRRPQRRVADFCTE
jgi:hypothetical protein